MSSVETSGPYAESHRPSLQMLSVVITSMCFKPACLNVHFVPKANVNLKVFFYAFIIVTLTTMVLIYEFRIKYK